MNRRAFASLLLLVAASVGCVGNAPVTTRVAAAEGGTVTASTHTVAIPALALAADTDVTLEIASLADYPALANARPEVLRIQPEGTVLERAATVTIRGSFIDAASASAVSISQLATGDGVRAWVPIASTRDAATGDVTVMVTRFEPLAVVVVDAASGGTIQGTIHWADASPVPMAPIELHSGPSRVMMTTSDANGQFVFTGVAAGEYRVVVSFECMIDQAVTVSAGAPTMVALTLCGR